MTLLDVSNLTVAFDAARSVKVVEDVSFSVSAGETLAIVGESGSGKSVSALAVLGLLPKAARIGGHILFDGQDIDAMPPKARQALRGPEIGMIFQDPMTSLNPTLTVGRQLTEMFELHEGLGRRAATAKAAEMLDLVGVPSPRQRLSDYPHQFSGGMRQRVMIAIAVACSPRLLIADEPTTALDVTIQAQILDLIRRLQGELGMGVILISHDLGVVAGMADRMAVMYSGRIVEEGSVDAIFDDPRMPYTRGLLASVPRFDQPVADIPAPIPGAPPDPARRPEGCRFGPRCALRHAACATEPPLSAPGTGHAAACHLAWENAT